MNIDEVYLKLSKNNCNVSATAKELGISREYLHRYLKKNGWHRTEKIFTKKTLVPVAQCDDDGFIARVAMITRHCYALMFTKLSEEDKNKKVSAIKFLVDQL